jgi:hypothetical protein
MIILREYELQGRRWQLCLHMFLDNGSKYNELQKIKERRENKYK